MQSNNPETKNESSGRARLTEAVIYQGATQVCLGLDDGNVRWQQTRNFPPHTQHIYGLFGSERYLTICSHNEKTVRFQLEAYDGANGQRLWKGALDSGRPIGGEHGEQDRHPLIMGTESWSNLRCFLLAQVNAWPNTKSRAKAVAVGLCQPLQIPFSFAPQTQANGN